MRELCCFARKSVVAVDSPNTDAQLLSLPAYPCTAPPLAQAGQVLTCSPPDFSALPLLFKAYGQILQVFDHCLQVLRDLQQRFYALVRLAVGWGGHILILPEMWGENQGVFQAQK